MFKNLIVNNRVFFPGSKQELKEAEGIRVISNLQVIDCFDDVKVERFMLYCKST